MKYENTRIVIFKEDYYVKTRTPEGKKLLHAKGSRHAMHKGIVAILRKNNAKIEVIELDYKKAEEKVKKRKDEPKRKSFEVKA
jgi:hypothetical protein